MYTQVQKYSYPNNSKTSTNGYQHFCTQVYVWEVLTSTRDEKIDATATKDMPFFPIAKGKHEVKLHHSKNHHHEQETTEHSAEIWEFFCLEDFTWLQLRQLEYA